MKKPVRRLPAPSTVAVKKTDTEPWPRLADKGVFSDWDRVSTPRLWWGADPAKTSFTVRTAPKVLTILQGKVPVKSYRYKSTVTFTPGSYGSGKASGDRFLFTSALGAVVAIGTGEKTVVHEKEHFLRLSRQDFKELKRFLARPLTVLTAAEAKKNDLDGDGIPDQVDTLMGAIKLAYNNATYDDRYFAMKYPMGDPPKDRGVCTDVAIRALRNAGADLQRLIHRDIVRNRSRYRYITSVDRSIDHRRIRTMLPYLKAHCQLLHTAVTRENAREFLPGDIVLMDITTVWPGADHVGIVSEDRGKSGLPMIIHNASNTRYEDAFVTIPMLFHFRCNYRSL